MAGAGAGVEEIDAVLSDVEEEDHPAATVIGNHKPEHVPVEQYTELLAELYRERAARRAAEDSKEEAVEKFNRIRKVAQEAIQKRDECMRLRDQSESDRVEALKSLEKMTAELNEVAEQRDEIARQLDGAMKARDSFRVEMENSRHLLVSGIEKISGKLSDYKNFAAAGGLPKSTKYSGMPAVAYGVLKRTNDIVEELFKQIHAANQSRNDARAQIEQRNFEIAIEVSQLEATIGGLRRELEGKTSLIGELQKAVAEKEIMASEIERGMWEKAELEDKLRNLETKMEHLKPLLIDQSTFSWKIHNQLFGAMKIVDKNYHYSEPPASLFFQEEKDIGENLSASLAGMKSIYELTRIVGEKTRGVIHVKDHELKRSAETVGQLVREKEHISYLLRSALSKRPTWDPSSKANDLFQAAENGLRDAGIDFKFSKFLGDHKFPASPRENGGGLLPEPEEGEIYTLADALEKVVKASQLEIIELRHCVEELRNESSSLRAQIGIQAKELSSRIHKIEELEEKQRAANENIEGLLMDITAAEEEIRRWKITAEQEAAAGHAVEKGFVGQLTTLKKEVEEAKQATLESEKKVKLKEETAAAAMAAREAAEKSLRLADVRASRLRERIEELSRQLEEFETRDESARTRNRPRYVCWWPFRQWPGLDLVVGTYANHETQQEHIMSSNEMEELSEPLV